MSLLADLTVDCRAAPALTSFNRIPHTELYLKVGFNLKRVGFTSCHEQDGGAGVALKLEVMW